MSSDFQFVDTGAEALVAELITEYESMTGGTVLPASPDNLLIRWAASAIVQTRAMINYAANQNIPSRATGANLDTLGEEIFVVPRQGAKAAGCTMRFALSAAQSSAVLIPAGTRVTDSASTLFWATERDYYIPPGDTAAELAVICQTTGSAGNGYEIGQINAVVDRFPYFSHCSNITASAGGADVADDAAYYQYLRQSQDALSVAGPTGAYHYWAKTVSTDIADVVAMMPSDPATGQPMGGHVYIYALMDDGTIASDTIKSMILAACNDSEVRPLTDFVSVQDPGVVDYNIAFTYYVPTDSELSAADIRAAVEEAVNKYIRWQCGKLGRDINPSRLISMLMGTGIKRVELTEPVFAVLNDGTDHTAPSVARNIGISITDGGHEDE